MINTTPNATSILIVDECRRSGSLSEALITALLEAGVTCPLKRLTAEDSFIPLASAANLVLPATEQIVDAVVELSATGSNEETPQQAAKQMNGS